tara:strand:- start:5031 stop:6875 length:1845 start_codon:yes stop_codon:yes gene_type:complete
MRIPLYQSKLLPTNEAPGRAFQTRKNAQPFIQSALRQASVGQALSSAIGNYALHRYNMAEQLRLDEVTIEGQNALRQLAYDYTKDGNPESVLDGSNPRWFSDVETLRKRLIKKLGKNQTALQKFNASFNITESNQRFSLRNTVTSNSKTKQDKLNNTKFDAAVIALSNLDGKTPSEAIASYNAAMLYLETDLQGQIDKGLTDDNYKIVAFNTANKQIAANLIKAWGNNDPLKISALEAFYNDRTNNKSPEGAEYLDHVLKELNNADSLTILNNAFNDAIKKINDEKKLYDNIETVRDELKNTYIDNYFAIESTDAKGDEIQYRLRDVQNLIPGYKDFDASYSGLLLDALGQVREQGREYFTGAEVQSIILQMVDNPLKGITITDDMRTKMEQGFLGNADRIFVTGSDHINVKIQATNNYQRASILISEGNIGMQELHDMLNSTEYPGGFTQNDFSTLKNEVNAMRDKNFADLTSALKAEYQILGETAMNAEFGDLLSIAYFDVQSRLRKWYAANRDTADRETIADEILNIKKQVGEKQAADFIAMMKAQMGKYNGLYNQMENKFDINASLEEIEQVMAKRIEEKGSDPFQGGEIAIQNANIRSLMQVIRMLRGL